MRFTVCLVLVIGALYVLAGIALYAFQNRLLYVPESADQDHAGRGRDALRRNCIGRQRWGAADWVVHAVG